MIIDKRLEFSDAQALTATAASTNVVDLGSDRDIGPGRAMWVVLSLDVAADGTTGDETYVADVETDDNAAFSSAATIATATITRGDVAGSRGLGAFRSLLVGSVSQKVSHLADCSCITVK